MYTIKKNKGYKSSLSLKDTQRAIKLLKDEFEDKLAATLNLGRVTAPLLVCSDSGINDDLSGAEFPVSFKVKNIENKKVEIVQSLAKWKRVALSRYGYKVGEGIYTDMNAVRPFDDVDNTHSIYVDQWDWEFIIDSKSRTVDFLKQTVNRIVDAICTVLAIVKKQFSSITTTIEKEVFFITAKELYNLYPNLSATDREFEITQKHKTVFVIGIGEKLSDGKSHGSRAPDYDDWSLNGDLLFWNDILSEPIELSSMGIRVDSSAMASQLKLSKNKSREKFDYHKQILQNKLPLTIGGGIGQSRLCMLLLQKLHIGEVQVSVWPEDMLAECRQLSLQIL